MNTKALRHHWQMTQQELSALTGISLRQIRDIESGKVSPRHIKADTVLRLARAFGVSMEEIMGETFEVDGKILYLDEFEWLGQPTTLNNAGT